MAAGRGCVTAAGDTRPKAQQGSVRDPFDRNGAESSLPDMQSVRSPRSLRHEYDVYLEREGEAYKESMSREYLLGVAELAHASLEGELQLGMRDVLLAAEVDRIIAKRLKIPSFDTWRRRRTRNAAEPKRPEYWGLRGDTPLAQAINS